MPPPIIGITPDVAMHNGRERAQVMLAYSDAVRAAGGVPIHLTPDADTAQAQLALCNGIVLTGGDDPRMEPFGVPTHPKATPLHPRRQAFETRLLALLHQSPRPALGVCLGMQMMALCAGGRLDQHLPDSRPDAHRHWDADHNIVRDPNAERSRAPVDLAQGPVHSKHRQAVTDPGSMLVLARSPDGVIEAIADPARPFHVGVQWHPERTVFDPLGLDLFRQLVHAAGRARDHTPS